MTRYNDYDEIIEMENYLSEIHDIALNNSTRAEYEKINECYKLLMDKLEIEIRKRGF